MKERKKGLEGKIRLSHTKGKRKRKENTRKVNENRERSRKWKYKTKKISKLMRGKEKKRGN